MSIKACKRDIQLTYWKKNNFNNTSKCIYFDTYPLNVNKTKRNINIYIYISIYIYYIY